MSAESYAQNFEDVMLKRALKHVEKGSYIDIGAQDPVHDSVSLAFYKLGWRGVHVEAAPSYANKLRDARPDEVVIEAAVSDVEGLIPFHEIRDTGLSTGRADVAEAHRKSGWESSIITVPTIRLEQVFELIDGPIHWLKIDVEGMEGAVLDSWGESQIRPWILVIESTFPNSQKQTDDGWSNKVTKRGYDEVYFDGLSRFYLHRDQTQLSDAFVAPPNIFDGFQVSDTHFSTGELMHRYADELGRREQAHVNISEARQRDQAEIDALKAEVALRDETLGELTERVSEARETILDLEARVRALIADTAADETELARLNEQLNGWTQRLEHAQQAFDASIGEQAARYEVEIVRSHERIESAKQRLDETQKLLSESHASHESLTQLLLAAEREHRKMTEALWQDRRTTEDALRASLESREDALVQTLRRAEGSETAARIELARANERMLHLEERVQQTGKDAALIRSELTASQHSASEASARFENVAQEMQRQFADANANADRVERALEKQLADAKTHAIFLEQDTVLRVADVTAAAENNEKLLKRELADAFIWGHSLEEELRRQQRELADAFAWGHGLEDEMQWRLSEADVRANLVHQETARRRVESDFELKNVGASLAHADRLINDVIAEPLSRWRRFGFTLGFDRLSSAQLALRSWSPEIMHPFAAPPLPAVPAYNSTESLMHPEATTSRRNPYIRANSLDELLSWHDVDFVRCAYVTLLGRQPDPEGEAECVVQLRRGISKMTILRQLRRSSEARAHDPGIEGLDRELRKHRNATTPFFGAFFRAIAAREGDTKRERQTRTFENRFRTLAESANAMQSATGWIAERLQSFQSELNGRVDSVVAEIVSTHGRFDQMQSSQNELCGRVDNVMAEFVSPHDRFDQIQLSFNQLREELCEEFSQQIMKNTRMAKHAQLITIENVLEKFGSDLSE